MEAAAEKSRSATVLDLQTWAYYNCTRLPAGEPTIRSPRTVSAWSEFLMPFLPFVYGYRSSSPRARCTPNWSVPTLHYTVGCLKCCLTSTETVGLLGTGAQDIHLDFHTAPELWLATLPSFRCCLMSSGVLRTSSASFSSGQCVQCLLPKSP